ncbi:chlorophyllase/cutinase-like alpha/beta fold protein [Telluribacter sp. SYSU D00476]|uniref:alpha/beta hydrolase n=1 Tax=Telluribacter sp. SYSU D00476 TaxID=2811430 RepID=UPI001FF6BD69|nr:hypothetical protein [Telluribacter sp. SYSU D00476]
MKNLLAIAFLLTSLVARAQSVTEPTTPKPTGPWNVGVRLLEWVDSTRIDPSDSTRFRTLPVWVWYPAAKGLKPTPHYPLPDRWRQEQGRYLDKKVGKAGSQYLQHLNVWSVPDAAVAAEGGPFPVLLFGPGHTWLPTDYSTLIEDIVSHGYMVVGYVPTGFPGVTQLASGAIVPGTLTVHQQDIVFADAQFVRRRLNRLASSWLRGTMDTTQVGIWGHSQGGIAATVVAARDSTIKVVVNLDGDLMGSALRVKVKQPALLLSNDERIGIQASTQKMDREGRERSEYRRHADWVRATDDTNVSLRVRITGIRHLNFNDLALIPAGEMTAAERKDKLGPADGAGSLRTISPLTRQFFDAYLRKDKFYTLVQLEETYPEVQALLWKGLPYYEQQ